jgi:hypothetical protein
MEIENGMNGQATQNNYFVEHPNPPSYYKDFIDENAIKAPQLENIMKVSPRFYSLGKEIKVCYLEKRELNFYLKLH